MGTNKGNRFDLDFVYRFASINKFLNEESWTNDQIESLQYFLIGACLKEFKTFHSKEKSEDIEDINREIIQVNMDKKRLLQI